ncbi:hypothetical protein O1611_g8488 [Lasiodiplodia mahajangana]|uniref:Uncharacterized protein n=1 Tax=Lasiodiplodia mahajangana TaxID=1108764 RepID=A0ACC2JCC2_9PEZI|nr:hypothetical protein O1611_g8488 [Lasiodiplodia mahajangana]
MHPKLPPLQFVRSVLKSFMAESGLEPRLLGGNVSPMVTMMSSQLNQQTANRLKILHGGTIASMVDLGGSLAVASTGLYATGVSTDLNVTYLSGGGKVGDKITGSAICDKSKSPFRQSNRDGKSIDVYSVGKTLAYTSVTFRNSNGELAARGSHTKYVTQAVKTQESPFVPPEGAEIADEK